MVRDRDRATALRAIGTMMRLPSATLPRFHCLPFHALHFQASLRPSWAETWTRSFGQSMTSLRQSLEVTCREAKFAGHTTSASLTVMRSLPDIPHFLFSPGKKSKPLPNLLHAALDCMAQLAASQGEAFAPILQPLIGQLLTCHICSLSPACVAHLLTTPSTRVHTFGRFSLPHSPLPSAKMPCLLEMLVLPCSAHFRLSWTTFPAWWARST